ncbi:GIY-YIG nuclease family protein [Nocardioides halotolerans]|jgi:predicted GIY-YIG superfamily endonuclease|uniref:GIY-YIG nuclease family protein n=1 Tax=Nocardioides halotolerans TaxID=433660 RepID=UPI0004172129|nr:GIY-YIG nuclease family protein [Nocardioides halotolerans]
MPYTYMVRCNDDTYYVGSTWDLDGRIWQHNHSPDGAVYTRRRRPVELVWNAEFDSIEQAFAFEKRIAGWSRAKKEALIRGDYDALIALSRRKGVQDREREKAAAEDAEPRPAPTATDPARGPT